MRVYFSNFIIFYFTVFSVKKKKINPKQVIPEKYFFGLFFDNAFQKKKNWKHVRYVIIELYRWYLFASQIIATSNSQTSCTILIWSFTESRWA